MKAIFLDRDGVINKYPGDKLYVTSLRKFRFLPGVKKAIALLSRSGFKIFIASNQAGVGRGILIMSLTGFPKFFVCGSFSWQCNFLRLILERIISRK